MSTLWKSKQPYNVNVAASVAAQVSLEHKDELKKYVELLKTERERLYEELHDIPYLKPYPTRSNFILCRVIEKDALQLKKDLAEKHGIFIRYFSKPGLKDCVRISVGRPHDTDALITALRNL
jgi:histidinol-phosphate aminotransferase